MPKTSPQKTGPGRQEAEAKAETSFLKRLALAFIRYGVIAFILVLIQKPQYFQDTSKSIYEKVVGIVTLKAVTQKSSPVANPTVNQWLTPSGEFDDAAFMAGYVCDQSHGYTIQILNRDPLLIKIKNFLAPGEADHLIELGKPGLARSTVVSKEKNELHPSRTSSNAFLIRSQDKVVTCVELRASEISRQPLPNIEPLQVVWYTHGQEYKPHFDYFPIGSAGSERELERGGQRLVTIFAYLNTVEPGHGGETSFPELGLNVSAIKNDAAFWYDTDVSGKDDSRTLHGGSPVFDTEKWGLNVWIRGAEFK